MNALFHGMILTVEQIFLYFVVSVLFSRFSCDYSNTELVLYV